jgi:hypothetical protein
MQQLAVGRPRALLEDREAEIDPRPDIRLLVQVRDLVLDQAWDRCYDFKNIF